MISGLLLGVALLTNQVWLPPIRYAQEQKQVEPEPSLMKRFELPQAQRAALESLLEQMEPSLSFQKHGNEWRRLLKEAGRGERVADLVKLFTEPFTPRVRVPADFHLDFERRQAGHVYGKRLYVSPEGDFAAVALPYYRECDICCEIEAHEPARLELADRIFVFYEKEGRLMLQRLDETKGKVRAEAPAS